MRERPVRQCGRKLCRLPPSLGIWRWACSGANPGYNGQPPAASHVVLRAVWQRRGGILRYRPPPCEPAPISVTLIPSRGSALLGITAAGLLAFGLYGIAEAAWIG
jgi:hypothetical protein